MSVSSAVLESATPTRGSNKGAEIRAKIAANRAKRLKIADAMKKEAGVTAHTVHQEDFGGYAYFGTGRIYSPEGRKIVQLYTLAHECGHIFLHNSGPGYALPTHVKEFEAESYAHQAFREHGMTLPRRLSTLGREYVASWIDKDRAANIPIDPRAVAYAAGRLSPYEPLRMVPATWKIFHATVDPAAPTIAARHYRQEWSNVLGPALAALALAIVCLVFPDHPNAHFDLHYLVPLGLLMATIQALLLIIPLACSRRPPRVQVDEAGSAQRRAARARR